MYYLQIATFVLAFGQWIIACPFCSALKPSLYQEFENVDLVAIASCTGLPSVGGDLAGGELPLHSFQIEGILQGASLVGGTRRQENLKGSTVLGYSSESFRLRDKALVFGIRSEGEIAWAPSSPMSSVAVEYVIRMNRLRSSASASGAGVHSANSLRKTLDLYFEALESEDKWVQEDAYNDLAVFSIEELRPWASTIDSTVVKNRISQRATSREHRRFYWTVLGLCGGAEDTGFVKAAISRQLEQRQSNPISRDSIGLDAALSCFLLLGGEERLSEIERLFFQNRERHESEVFAAVSALRVHVEEFQVLEKSRVCKSLAMLLDDETSADQVIPDLARLKDWGHLEKLRAMLRDSRPERKFLLVPIINYFRACPLPEAEAALAEAREIAPAAVRRASTIFPVVRDDD